MSSNAQSQDATSVVYIIDDEESTRSSLHNLLRSVGFTVRSFDSTAAFKASEKNAGPSCMLLDVRLRGESGLFFQQQEKANQQMPIIFMTGFADVSICIKAMKAGAADFLLKPLAEQDVIDAVTAALAQDKKRLEADYQRSTLIDLYESLTSREREVLAYVVGGALNKQIAAGIGISEITVKVHRGTAMKKMKSNSVADLVRKAQVLGIEPMSR
ncbi:MAG: DNA-binding response regulator [Cupriavidus sp.]|jgi:FixJ family two-component response regulator|uniref:response regulator transcription factor n=1 Tax=Cupriavidus pauculus TaxID=82633 RepID=UPI00078192AA|nr:response regulator [Cupriavidus pauculus]MBU64058.1 DNA-binding response regulator [Cupriavidus sp.]KAB0599949.1 response regulator transcription factor [Cupriavidus pauculus]MBY4732598.1 response regulator [Cupriavidus pauculus]MCM3604680.1 response regulator [Cupriavidus pauculus]UAK98722.1 response regulator [Cupriavidus pauculus]